jgi:predicted transcriptional regulator
MVTKDKIIEAIKSMPEEKFEDIDVLIERLIILDKVEQGMKDIEQGNSIKGQEMKKEIDSWFRK